MKIISRKFSTRIRLCGEPGERGIHFEVSAEDAVFVAQHRWYLSTAGYVVTALHDRSRYKGRSRSATKNMALHREIALRIGILTEERPWVDHRDGDTLNCKRDNLRAVTPQENVWNLRQHRDRTIKGFSVTETGRYQVLLGGENYGNYETQRTAELVYDRVSRAVRGEFAVLIHPDSQDELPEDFPIPGLNTSKQAATFRSNEPGVSYITSKPKRRKRWRLIIQKRTIGYFYTEQEAVDKKRELGL